MICRRGDLVPRGVVAFWQVWGGQGHGGGGVHVCACGGQGTIGRDLPSPSARDDCTGTSSSFISHGIIKYSMGGAPRCWVHAKRPHDSTASPIYSSLGLILGTGPSGVMP
jgi:hypothetical protein